MKRIYRGRLAGRILGAAVWLTCASASPAFQTSSRAALALPKAPPPVAGGNTHLVYSGATATPARIGLWLFQSIYLEFPDGTFRGDIVSIGTNGAARSVEHVGAGLAHLTATTPAATAYMAYKGVGLYSKAYPNLRGLFKTPARDLVTVAVRADLGVQSFDEAVRKKMPLRIVSGYQDGSRCIGFFFAAFLRAYGTSLAELESWGGKLLPDDHGDTQVALLADGKANAIISEGVMVGPRWKELNQKVPMRVLSIPDGILQKLGQFGFKKFERTIRKGEFPGVVEDVTTVDFSDMVVVISAAVPDEIAYKLARAAVEKKRDFESQYQDMAPLGAKTFGRRLLDPREMWKDLGVPLHPGAEKYYREKGLMP